LSDQICDFPELFKLVEYMTYYNENARHVLHIYIKSYYKSNKVLQVSLKYLNIDSVNSDISSYVMQSLRVHMCMSWFH